VEILLERDAIVRNAWCRRRILGALLSGDRRDRDAREHERPHRDTQCPHDASGGSWIVCLNALFCGASRVWGRGTRRGIIVRRSATKRLTPVAGPASACRRQRLGWGCAHAECVSRAEERSRARTSGVTAASYPSSDPNPRVVAVLAGAN